MQPLPATSLIENRPFSQVNGNGFEMVGAAPSFRGMAARLPALANASEAVLITGETGTGKERVARAIHGMSPRADGPFVVLNCGSLADTLLERELLSRSFGETLFLDEVDALTTRGQVVLLRAIEELQSHVRLIAATHRSLESRVQSGQFRADLYYRLSVFSIELPPLRERREDILPLSAHFIAKHGNGASPGLHLSTSATEALLVLDWPGNIRELESAIVRGIRFCQGATIEPQDLGIAYVPATAPASPVSASTYKEQKRQVLDAFERQYIVRLMTEHHGNVTRAARAAGRERRDLGKRLKRLGIDPRSFVGE
jgi:DNA-binding NtrC family response regulator